jgi:hypothetical protein
MLAEKLNMGTEEAERWIVNLIRNASLDAKIDSQKGVVVMGSQALSPYQIVIEKTKNLFNRSQLLAQNSEKKRDTNVSLLQFFFIHRKIRFFRQVGAIIKLNNLKPVELFH